MSYLLKHLTLFTGEVKARSPVRLYENLLTMVMPSAMLLALAHWSMAASSNSDRPIRFYISSLDQSSEDFRYLGSRSGLNKAPGVESSTGRPVRLHIFVISRVCFKQHKVLETSSDEGVTLT